MNLRALIIALTLLVAPAAFAAPTIGSLEQRWSLLDGHRARLERLLSDQVQRIQRLKSQPTGVRRDFQLKQTLRRNQQLAARLTRLQQQLRALNGQLLAAYDQALKQTKDPTRRRELRQ